MKLYVVKHFHVILIKIATLPYEHLRVGNRLYCITLNDVTLRYEP